jgi:hypothetical protein
MRKFDLRGDTRQPGGSFQFSGKYQRRDSTPLDLARGSRELQLGVEADTARESRLVWLVTMAAPESCRLHTGIKLLDWRLWYIARRRMADNF